ncbi:MAG: four helix bundle protein [Planctomycetota bacterium]|nr:four helix bundle protein [Planctomycetota bacterium]
MDVVRDFRDLVVWQRAMDLSVDIYRATKRFPKEERYGLTSQMRRAAVSIPSNIAEGNGRNSGSDYLRFLAIANGSLAELKTQILLSERIGYLDPSGAEKLFASANEVGWILAGLVKALQKEKGER